MLSNDGPPISRKAARNGGLFCCPAYLSAILHRCHFQSHLLKTKDILILSLQRSSSTTDPPTSSLTRVELFEDRCDSICGAYPMKNWKTTASGILTITLAGTAALLTYPPFVAHAKWVLILGGAQVVGKAWISILQKDAQ